MKYSLKLNIKTENPNQLFSVFHADSMMNTDRAKTEIKEAKEGFVCIIAASDIVALKASVNSVIKTLEIYEKTQTLVEGK